MRKIIVSTLLGLGSLGFIAPNDAKASWLSEALDHTRIDVRIGSQYPAYAPAPVYSAPPAYPVYAPQYRAYSPAPVYGPSQGYQAYSPAPVYAAPRGYQTYSPAPACVAPQGNQAYSPAPAYRPAYYPAPTYAPRPSYYGPYRYDYNPRDYDWRR